VKTHPVLQEGLVLTPRERSRRWNLLDATPLLPWGERVNPWREEETGVEWERREGPPYLTFKYLVLHFVSELMEQRTEINRDDEAGMTNRQAVRTNRFGDREGWTTSSLGILHIGTVRLRSCTVQRG
jgi:hypothetical protein